MTPIPLTILWMNEWMNEWYIYKVHNLQYNNYKNTNFKIAKIVLHIKRLL